MSPTLLEARHVSVSIAKPPREVYRFAAAPENLVQWASGLGGAKKQRDGTWLADGGPLGKVKVSFARPNTFGVLDHDVELPGGVKHNSLRVLPNGGGSEVVFTLMRQPGTDSEGFARDAETILSDLRRLKELVEGSAVVQAKPDTRGKPRRARRTTARRSSQKARRRAHGT